MAAENARDLDALVRRVDPDRWLTSRFIGDAEARADVIALYAYDYELARARKSASNPLIAEIRLTWWREALDEVFDRRPVRRHPTAEALADAVRRRELPRAPLEAMIDGWIELLEKASLDAAEARAWAGAVQGSLARLAAMVLDRGADPSAAEPAGRVWGLALLQRAGLASPQVAAPALREALAEARAEARRIGVAAFPAALPATLARYDIRGASPGPLAKQLRLVLAAATGRL